MLVSQPVTTSTCPVISGIMSEPMVTICTSFASILFFASSARSRITPVAWMPTFLPGKSAGVRTGFFCSEKKV